MKNKSIVEDNISDKLSLDQEMPSNRGSSKPPTCRKNASFSERVRIGWTKEQLMKHFSMSEKEYENVIISLKNVKKS